MVSGGRIQYDIDGCGRNRGCRVEHHTTSKMNKINKRDIKVEKNEGRGKREL